MLFALALGWLAWLLALPPRPSKWLVVLAGIPLVALGSWIAKQRTDEGWRQFARRTFDLHALAVVLLFALGVQLEDAHGVTTDGVIFFSQLRSVLFDGDLDVAREFAFLDQPARPSHVVPIGPTLVWLPLYLVVAVVDAAGRALGAWNAPADPVGIGLTLPYIRAALLSSFAIGAVGLIALHRHLTREFRKTIAFSTTLLIFAATPLVWYMVYEPSMTHAASFGFVALFVVAAARWASVTIATRQAIVLGALIGLAFITRPQEALFALVPAVLLLTSTEPVGVRVRALVKLGLWAFVGALPFLILQAIHSTILLSRENLALVGPGGYLDFLDSQWAGTLWSSWHGFLSWTPIAYVALVGSVAYATRSWRWTVAIVLVVFLMAWVNGSTADWAGGWSFGGRRFVSCLVVLAPGLAFLIAQLMQKPMVAMGIVAVALIAWNQLLVAQYERGLLPKGEAVSFGQIVRQQADLLTRPPFFYPFAFPANAWFAWRTGLPIDRYDLLGPEPLRPTVDIELDDAAGKFLLDGWGPRASDQWGPLRWIDADRAELVLPLDVSGDAPQQVNIQARTRLLDPPSRAKVVLSINGQQIGMLTPDTEQPSAASLKASPGVIRRGFNRVVFEKQTGAPPVAIYRVMVR